MTATRTHLPAALAPQTTKRDNLTGIIAMLASMAAFVINDTCVKLASDSLPIGEIIALRNTASTAYLLAFAAIVGGLTLPRNPPIMLVTLRMVGEIIATLLFLTALVTLPLADMTAIAQFTPLALTAAAAIFLGEHVGWRRWSATLVGLIGVGFIVRPGSASFSLAGAMVLASSAAGIIAGLILLPFETWHIPNLYESALVALAGLFLTFGYAFIIIALRTGDVGLVSPFRYAIILFALIASYLIWGHIPDHWAMLGIVILCAAGLYTVHRERLRLRTQPLTH
jgi:drug/metabolite transporter (DMT)-like permease